MTKPRVLLFNPTCIVHLRNMEVLQRDLSGFIFRSIHNPDFPWFSKDERGRYGKSCGEEFTFSRDYAKNIPPKVFEDVAAVILFTAQARIPPSNLIYEAHCRRIPVIAIEEVHAMMLEQGYINNYVMPVDHLFVASEYERRGFSASGLQDNVVEVTGCAFRHKECNRLEGEAKRAFKSALGLSPDKKVALLALACLGPDWDTIEVRRAIFAPLVEGLPPEYEFLIKRHPSDRDVNFINFVKQYAPKAKVAETTMPIENILGVTDVVFNRGNSQVMIDSIQNDIPALPVPAGRKTFFHGVLDDMIIQSADDVRKALANLQDRGMEIYKEVFETHLTIRPEDALQKTTARIRDIAQTGQVRESGEKLIQLSLYWAWMGHPGQALRILDEAKPFVDKDMARALRSIVRLECAKESMVLLRERIGRGYLGSILQSLWIKNMYMRGKMIGGADREYLASYPPRMNRSCFLEHTFMLYWTFRRSGLHKEAESVAAQLQGEYGIAFSAGTDLSMMRLRMRLKQEAKNILFEAFRRARPE